MQDIKKSLFKEKAAENTKRFTRNLIDKLIQGYIILSTISVIGITLIFQYNPDDQIWGEDVPFGSTTTKTVIEPDGDVGSVFLVL